MTTKPIQFSSTLFSIALLILMIVHSGSIIAKTSTPTPKEFPAVRVNGTDEVSFNTAARLETKKPTVVIYFSPICGACDEQIRSITSTMEQMEDVEFLLVTSYEPEEIKLFLEAHQIADFENIRVGYDANLNLRSHYSITAIPSFFLYSAEGELTQEWIGITSTEELTAALTGKHYEN